MGSIWMAIMSFIGGPVIKGLIDAYNSYLTAQTKDEKIAADLAGKEIAAQQIEIQAQTQLKIAEIGHPFEVEKLFAYVTLVYYAKLMLWDKVLGSFMGETHSIFATDGLNSYDAVWGGMVVTYYFAKRGFENVARIIKK